MRECDADAMGEPAVCLRFDEELRFFLAPRNRRLPGIRAAPDGTSTVGHLVESLGVPLTEVGAIAVNGRTTAISWTSAR